MLDAYKVIKRYYIVRNEECITEKTLYFDWVGERDVFTGVCQTEKEFKWRTVALNGKYGIVDVSTGEMVLSCIYNSIGASCSPKEGPYLILRWEDENNTKHEEVYSATKREMISLKEH